MPTALAVADGCSHLAPGLGRLLALSKETARNRCVSGHVLRNLQDILQVLPSPIPFCGRLWIEFPHDAEKSGKCSKLE